MPNIKSRYTCAVLMVEYLPPSSAANHSQETLENPEQRHMEIQFQQDSREAIRKRIQKMSDPELLRYGNAAKFMCSPDANFGKAPETFVFQLEEARKEWRRRYPKLPLSEAV